MPTYTGISSEAFRHPLDRQAELALRSVPGFDLIASKFVEFVYERPQYVYLMGNSIQVGPRQYASIYHLFRECVRDLDVFPEPTLFVSLSCNSFLTIFYRFFPTAMGRSHADNATLFHWWN